MLLSARRTIVVCSLVLAIVSGPLGAFGASLDWQAPAQCPSSERVTAQISRELGAELDALPELAFRAEILPSSGGFELVLKVRAAGPSGGVGETSERHIRATTCEGAVDALSAAMALALHSLAEEGGQSAASDAEQGTPKPDTSRQDASEPVADKQSVPGPPPVLRPNQSEVSPLVIHTIAGLGVLLDVGAFPEPALGATASIGITVAKFGVGLRGVMLPTQRATVRGQAQVDFQLLSAGLVLCSPRWGRNLAMQGCVGGDFGQIRGSGANGVTNPRSGTGSWIATLPEVRLLWQPNRGNFNAFLSTAAVVPLVREAFVFSDSPTSVHRPDALGLRASAGLEFNLF